MGVLKFIHSDKVHSLSTKFFYKDRTLCYQIMLSYDGSIYYKNFDIYEDYRSMHEQLVNAINKKESIPNVFLAPVAVEA